MNDMDWSQSGWEDFGKWLSGTMPADLPNQHFQWIQDYVNGAMKDALTASASNHPSLKRKAALSYKMFQTHNHVIVRFQIPKSINPRNLALQASFQRIKLEGLPGGGKQSVVLPTFVSPLTSRSTYKDGILQVKLQKKKISEHFHDVYVRFN